MINPNEPAFPVTENRGMNGLDIRTHMAIQFMASRLQLWGIHTCLDEEMAERCAKETILAVDALIAELNKTTTNE